MTKINLDKSWGKEIKTYGVRVAAADLGTVVGGRAERRVIAGTVSAGTLLSTGAIGVRETQGRVEAVGGDAADVDAGVATVESTLEDQAVLAVGTARAGLQIDYPTGHVTAGGIASWDADEAEGPFIMGVP
ncbi:hypothetical protein HWV62_15705 [Athelia sp. TMB]|nr:hypothetical protein HWV62_15705 [Athelia sp. TMB]